MRALHGAGAWGHDEARGAGGGAGGQAGEHGDEDDEQGTHGLDQTTPQGAAKWTYVASCGLEYGRGMRIAVAGGTGLVGGLTVRALERAGHDPVVISRSANSKNWVARRIVTGTGPASATSS